MSPCYWSFLYPVNSISRNLLYLCLNPEIHPFLESPLSKAWLLLFSVSTVDSVATATTVSIESIVEAVATDPTTTTITMIVVMAGPRTTITTVRSTLATG